MEVLRNSIQKFIGSHDTIFTIPVYQRNYDWKEKHCNQLLKDIIDAGKNNNKESYFIGSIVFIKTNITTTPNVLTIIDGQQRLTTLTILYSVLYKKALEYGHPDIAKQYMNRYLINEDLKNEEKIKLKPSNNDNIALKNIIENMNIISDEYSRIYENYEFFNNKINIDNFSYITEGLKKLVFIEVGLEKNKDEPQEIFQSLNSTGLDLSQGDLIRNYILMGLDFNIQEKIYKQYWTPIEENTTEEKTKNTKLSEFIRDYLTFNFHSIPNQDKVFEFFKEKFPTPQLSDLEILLQDLKKYSESYYYLINPDKETDEIIKEHLYLINKLQISVSYPFLIQVYNDFKTNILDKDTLVKVLELIQSYTWRRFICSIPTNALNKIFMVLYKEIDKENYINSLEKSLLTKKANGRFPNNDEVFSVLKTKDMYNIQSKNRTYFLERLNNYQERIKVNIEGNQDVTIEHIFPQKSGKEWRNLLENEFDTMIKFSNTAANLTLSAFNKELSNKPFIEKRDLPDKGYKYSPLKIDKFLAGIDTWNMENLNLRLDWIFNRFKKVWYYPEIEVDSLINNDTQEFNILDIDSTDVINNKIEYFIFFNEKYTNQTWSSLLNTVSKIMFEREPHIFLNSDLGRLLKLSDNNSNYLKPMKISSNYYIESNLGSKNIVEKVQAILNACETDDELYIKLSKSNALFE